jgi:hypothetical protein
MGGSVFSSERCIPLNNISGEIQHHKREGGGMERGDKEGGWREWEGGGEREILVEIAHLAHWLFQIIASNSLAASTYQITYSPAMDHRIFF